VLFVEGRTEKLAFPFVFEALGYDADQEAIAIIDRAGKGNMPLFAEICNACGIPYIIVHDRDAPRGEQPAEAERIANDTILRVAGKRRSIMLIPDFEGVTGLKARRGKPAAALKRFRGGNGRSTCAANYPRRLITRSTTRAGGDAPCAALPAVPQSRHRASRRRARTGSGPVRHA